MTKRLCVALLLVMLVASTVVSASAEAALGNFRVVNCNSWVSLREEPSVNSRRLCKVPLGAVVWAWTICGSLDNDGVSFIGVDYNGHSGFIHAGYLTAAISGGTKKQDNRYDLDLYEYRPVTEKGRGALVFQKAPRGSFMKNHKFRDGDYVYVNVYWRQNGYAIAYEGGEYGYVDASYIRW